MVRWGKRSGIVLSALLASVIAFGGTARADSRGTSQVTFEVQDPSPAGDVWAHVGANGADPPNNHIGGTVEVHDSKKSYGTFEAWDHYSTGYNTKLGDFPIGTYTLTEVYSGDESYAPSSKTVTFGVEPQAVEVIVGADKGPGYESCPPASPEPHCNTVPNGTEISFGSSAYAQENRGNHPTPSGIITFVDNGQPMATQPMTDAGGARWKVVLPPGTHTVTTRYSGDRYYESATSKNSEFVLVTSETSSPDGPTAPTSGASRASPATQQQAAGASSATTLFVGASLPATTAAAVSAAADVAGKSAHLAARHREPSLTRSAPKAAPVLLLVLLPVVSVYVWRRRAATGR